MKNQTYFMKYNLQYFAKDGPGGEKTEPATGKKLKEARGEGQVAKSKELTSAFELIGLFITLKIFISYIGDRFISTFEERYSSIPDIVLLGNQDFSWRLGSELLNNGIRTILLTAAPFFVVAFVLALVVDLVQVKWAPTAKPLKPKLSKINPISGAKKIISTRSLFELIKSLAKIALIIYVCYTEINDRAGELYILYDIPMLQAILEIGSLAINLGIKVSVVYLIVGLADYIFNHIKFKNDMKMTKQEVKDEYKNTEGNPEVKGKIKSKMREMSRQRMMEEVPKADVIITNPTHLSIAVKYDQNKFKAPIVVAKGEDYLAMKIREIAKENQIELVENKPLARMLYTNVDIGGEVPPELYQAVAEVLAFVYNLKKKE